MDILLSGGYWSSCFYFHSPPYELCVPQFISDYTWIHLMTITYCNMHIWNSLLLESLFSYQRTIVYFPPDDRASTGISFRSTSLPIQLSVMCLDNSRSTWDWRICGMNIDQVSSIRTGSFCNLPLPRKIRLYYDRECQGVFRYRIPAWTHLKSKSNASSGLNELILIAHPIMTIPSNQRPFRQWPLERDYNVGFKS